MSLRIAGLLVFLMTVSLPAAPAPPTVEVAVDLLDRFPSAKVADCLEATVRRPATAGGVRKSALFEHPRTAGTPARVTYHVTLPELGEGDLLLLAFDIGLADGIQGGKGEDGVGFIVEIDGRREFAREWKTMKWQPGCVDLTRLGNRTVELALVTDALGNTSYDWALWGDPRILHFGGAASDPAAKMPASVGVVAVRPKPGTAGTLRLVPDTGEPLVKWNLPADEDARADSWTVFEFAFPHVTMASLDWEPRERLAPERIRMASYPAEPKVLRVSAARAAPIAGAPVPIHAEVRNSGRGVLPAAEVTLQVNAGTNPLPTRAVPELPPGETWRSVWSWRTPEQSGEWPLVARLSGAANRAAAGATNSVRTLRGSSERILLNEDWALDVFNAGSENALAQIVRTAGASAPLAVFSPLAGVSLETPAGPVEWRVPLRIAAAESDGATRVLEAIGARDPLGHAWNVRLTIEPVAQRPIVRLRYRWRADRNVAVRRFLGPNLYVGDGSTGEAKSWGLFPGLEYLYGPERSSNPRDFAPPLDDRRTPQPWKITIPLMAVTSASASRPPPENPGRFFTPDSILSGTEVQSPPRPAVGEPASSEFTAALWWDPLQKWDGEHAFPSARFASPNFDEGMENHRLALFLPSVPDFVSENADSASKAFPLRAGQTITLECTLVLAEGPVLTAAREWLRDRGGLPKPNPWPRSFQDELDVCRSGFLKTVWDSGSEKWRHCLGWAPARAPGFAALLWMDGHVAESAEARRQSLERVELAAQNMLREIGPGGLTSQAGCHIMQWEFPFLYGYLPEAIAGLDGQVRSLIASQRADGGWAYEPASAEQADLGRAGDSVLGTCANKAATLLRFARITGDPDALAAGEKALAFMERFRVPRGGQTWECPMYEPDILAAAYAIKACVDGYRSTGNPRWLHDAVYWAETGVPFTYLWSLPDKPMMLGATIPVFGSTFYTHSWLGVPVQWCGLVYAYHVLHLAAELEPRPVPRTDSPLPLALGFSPADWRRLAELILVSGMYQQFADGEKIGTYPDSISNFEKRNPAFINPEDLLVNLLALEGHDPDIRTVRLSAGRGNVIISSGARIADARATKDELSFELRPFRGESSHTLVSGFKPVEVRADDQPLPESRTPVQREPGWWWDESQRRLYLVTPTRAGASAVKVRALGKVGTTEAGPS